MSKRTIPSAGLIVSLFWSCFSFFIVFLSVGVILVVVGVVINGRLSLNCSFVVCIHFSTLPTPESCCVCVLHSRPVTGKSMEWLACPHGV